MPRGYRAGSDEQDLQSQAGKFDYLPHQVGHYSQVQLLVGRPGGKNTRTGLDHNPLVGKPA